MPNNTQISCDIDRIEAFLQQQLSTEEQSDFEAHLDDCQDCRNLLEASAASEELWAGVRESLSSQPLSLDQNDSAASDQPEFSHQTILDWLAPTDDDRMLGRLDAYEVMGVVGSGGMGVVLKALDPALHRYVAIKVLAPHLGCSGSARRRFSREARASAAVVHENVIEIHGVSEKDGLPYLVMPYVSGPSLQRRLDHEGPLELAEILRIGMQSARGLAAAHSQGLIHRDVKPANILLEQGIERVKLTDFGLARAADDASLTKSGVIAGTPQYMSPEQARGESIDQRSDLFSLGSVLYAMCTGRAPFRAETTYGVLRRITDDEPRPVRELNPDVPEWLCQIIDRLMSKEPDDRFQSAPEVAELLEQCLAHVQQPTVVPLPESLAPQRTGSRFLSLSRLTWTAFGALGFGLLALLLWQATPPPDVSGDWQGEQWGDVTLKQVKPGKYVGTYTDVFQGSQKSPHPERWGNNCLICHKGPEESLRTIELKWSRLDQRYRGTWAQGKQRFGRISVEVVDGEIRGFWDVNKKSSINPGIPEREAPLLWVRRTGEKTTEHRKDKFETLVEEFKRLIERRRYEDASALALKEKEVASDENARQLWELRSKFANQLVKARENSDEEQKLLELMDFPLQRIADSGNAHTNSPPQPYEVIAAVEKNEKLPENSLNDLFKQNRGNIRIVVEPVYDRVEEPRFYPLVGMGRLHRVRFKCTLYFTESDDLKWPGADKGKGKITKTVLIDHDHLIRAEESELSQRFDDTLPLGKPQNQDVADSSVPLFGGRQESDDELQFLLLWPRGSKMASRDGRAELELPGRLRMRGNRISFTLKNLPNLSKTTLYGSINRVPVNKQTRQFLNEHAVSLELNEGDLQMAARGTLMQYVFLPHQQPGEKWAGHFGVLRMGPVDAESDEEVRNNLKKRGELLVVLQLTNRQPDEKADSYELAPDSDNGTEAGPGTPPPTSSLMHHPFDCVIVDSKTGDPIPGKDFAIGLVFEIPETEDRPWQLVEQVLLGPGHPGTFQFEIPEKVMQHPDRDLIQVRWFVMHPQWEQFGEYDPPRVNELINNDPRTARDGLKRIALRPTNANSVQPESFNEFTVRVHILQNLGVQKVGRDPLRQLYQSLLEQYPEHPDRAAAMYEIAALWSNAPEDRAQFIIWLRKAVTASREGTPLWYKSRFWLQARLQRTDPDEAEQILTEILDSQPGPVNEVKVWNQRVTLALSQDDEERAEQICRQLHERMKDSQHLPEDTFERGNYYQEIQSSAHSLLNYWFHQSDVAGSIRRAKIEAFWRDYPFRHVDRYIEQLSKMPGQGIELQRIDPDEIILNRPFFNLRWPDPNQPKMTLSFQNAPYKEVVQLLAEKLELPVQFDIQPTGTFSYKSDKPIPAAGVLEILNRDLEDQHLEILRDDGRLRVCKVELAVLTPQQVVSRGAELYTSMKKVKVRLKVGSVQIHQVTDLQGNTWERWELVADHEAGFSIRISPAAEEALTKRGVEDIPDFFAGKVIEVEGRVYGVGRNLISRPNTIWTYHIDLDSSDQYRVVSDDAEIGQLPAEQPATTTQGLRFSKTTELTLAINSNKCYLDLDTGKTVHAPALPLSESEMKEDVFPSWDSGKEPPTTGLVGI